MRSHEMVFTPVVSRALPEIFSAIAGKGGTYTSDQLLSALDVLEKARNESNGRPAKLLALLAQSALDHDVKPNTLASVIFPPNTNFQKTHFELGQIVAALQADAPDLWKYITKIPKEHMAELHMFPFNVHATWSWEILESL